MRSCILAFASILLTSAFARADAIYLQGGRVLEGSARVEGERVVVELESGRLSLSRDEIVRIEKGRAPLDEAKQRERALAAEDLSGMLELANYCRDHDLPNRERALLERIVARAPDHAEARRRLGYVREGERWVARSEITRREQLAARVRNEREQERKRQQVELETATLQRDRAAAELKHAQAQLAQERETRRQAARPPSWYSPVIVAPAGRFWNGGWGQRVPTPLHQTSPWPLPAASAPATHDDFPPLNGFRSPASYIDDAQRAAYGTRAPR